MGARVCVAPSQRDPDCRCRMRCALAYRDKHEQKVAKQLSAAKQASVAFEAAQRKYDKLVKVHTQQSRLLQQLQDALRKSVAEGRVAKETIKTQEAVIARLEDMLEKTHMSRAGPVPMAPPGRAHPRNRHLRHSSDAANGTQAPGSRRSPSRPGTGTASDAAAAAGRPSSGGSAGTGAEGAGSGSDADHEDDEGGSDGDADTAANTEEEKGPLGELDIDPMDGGGDTMTVTKKAWNKAMAQIKAKHTRMTVRLSVGTAHTVCCGAHSCAATACCAPTMASARARVRSMRSGCGRAAADQCQGLRGRHGAAQGEAHGVRDGESQASRLVG